MGLFNFGKKKEEPIQGPRVPVDDVARMRRQGLSNNQIVQALQRNGFQSHQIFDAFNQADLRVPSPLQGMQQGMQPGMQGMPPRAAQRQQFMQPGPQGPQGMAGTDHGQESPADLGMPPVPPGLDEMGNEASITGPQTADEFSGLPGLGEDFGQGGQQPGQEPVQFPQQGESFPSQPASYGSYDASAKIEEISEAIIEEKWQDLMKDFNKIVEWKSSMEQRMAAIEQRLSDLKAGFDNLQRSVVDKVSDYDKSVKDVNTEMKALEQVFQKIIPTMTENVNELSRITKVMKSPQQQKKKQA
ncbi:hypothetical protein HYY73_03400 [Candidatus Woesearchaeota archaeon]|nr:hypothetical protein [Candidatus Woesearchaeota archaeon]